MSGAINLDLRIPIGGLFTILGAILAGYGLLTASDAAHYAPTSGLNINLWWGLVMLAFGVFFLLGARRSARAAGAHAAAMRSADQTPEGRATEERERRIGLER